MLRTGSLIMTAAKRSTSCSFLQWRGIRQDEHFTFDWKRVPDSLEKEKEKYAIYTEIIGDAKFSDEDVNIRDIEYTASKEPSEWLHVQHLIDVCAPRQISVPSDEPKSSGFFMPRAKPGDFSYFVCRAPSWMYPVYVSTLINRVHPAPGVTITSLKRIEGNIFKLKEDLDKFLLDRYEREFIGQANEMKQKIIYRGNLERDLKDFLKFKGF